MRQTIYAIALALTLTGCAALLPYLVAAGQLVQWVTAIVDQVDARSETYFDNIPNPGLHAQTRMVIAKVRAAIVALDEAILVAKETNDGDVEAAKAHLLKCYEELYRLLGSSGLLGADGSLGVAPGAAQPIPTPDELAARMAQ